MAGSGHLQTFRLLRYLRGRGSTEGQINYGTQMAVSFRIFIFLVIDGNAVIDVLNLFGHSF